MPGDEREIVGWLREPLGPFDVGLHVELPERGEVSDKIRTALEALVHELYADDAEGLFPTCPELNDCGDFMCYLGKCQALWKKPCLADVNCYIEPFA
jgi:hypothetical protein